MNMNLNQSDEDLLEPNQSDFFTYLGTYTQFLNEIQTYESNTGSKTQNIIPKVMDMGDIDLLPVKQDTNKSKRKGFEKPENVSKALKTNDKKIEEESDFFNNSLTNSLLTSVDKSTISQQFVNKDLEEVQKFKECRSFFGLPIKVKELIQYYKGIERLYEWQEEFLNIPAIKNHRNVVYALPSSAGKTLVAEILMLREIICRKKNVIFVLPYFEIAEEKVSVLSPFALAFDFLIEEYASYKGIYPPKKRRYKNSMYVATIKKALGLINSLIEKGRLNEIGLVVVDELHLIGEPEQGPFLEEFLTKIIYLNEMKFIENIQIVGISPMIGNLSDICTFLKADIYKKDFPPIEFTEYVKVNDKFAKINWGKSDNEMLEVIRREDFSYCEVLKKVDPDRLGGLVMEVVPQDSCLIFCSSKKNCQNVTNLLWKVVPPHLKEHKKKEKEDLITALNNETNNNICEILNIGIKFGIAYYHGGMSSEERRLLEDGFREGVIFVICCTSTLAPFINLSAKRVIVRKPYIGREFINLSLYKQMANHAGRTGFKKIGESILICKKKDLPKVKELLQSPINVLSNLHACEGKSLRRLLLSCVGLNIAINRRHLQQVVRMSLLVVQQHKLTVDVKNLTDSAISALLESGALQTYVQRWQTSSISSPPSNISLKTPSTNFNRFRNEDTLEAQSQKKPKTILTNSTKLTINELGKATTKGGLELSKARLLYADLAQAQKCLVRLDYLHLLFIVTPYDHCQQIKLSLSVYYNLLIGLRKSEKQTARKLGITKSFTMKLLTNQKIKNAPKKVLIRFYVSLMLYDLWNGMLIFDASRKYQIDRELIQCLIISSATFALNVVCFCEEIEKFWHFKHLLKNISEKLFHCWGRELSPLLELPAVKLARAKQLYSAGFETIQHIAKCDPNELVKHIQCMTINSANHLIAAAKLHLLEKVETLKDESENVLNGGV